MKRSAAVKPSKFDYLFAFVELGKPRITMMVLITTLGGYWLAPHVGTANLWPVLIGSALIVIGANALNMFLERDVDALMRRTQKRPLPSGRLQAQAALYFGIAISWLAIPLLTFWVNPLTAFLAALSLVIYVLIYTPMKRRSTAALLVGAIPGAIPPLMGWTAATGRISAKGLALFLILFIWQLPHFIAISLFLSDDYRTAGIKVVPIERGIRGAKERVVFYSFLMLIVSLQVVRVGLGGTGYLVTAVLLGATLVGLAIYGLKRRAGAGWARNYFRYTLIYLPALFAALLLSH